MRRAPRAALGGSLTRAGIASSLLLLSCSPSGYQSGEPEERPLFNLTPIEEPRLRPGPPTPGDTVGGPTELSASNPYEGNVYAIQEGYELYRWMNCNGCHGDGGGSIGPALWDEQWIYGGSPAQIAESIIRGRPNGMPAFGGRIPEDQVWKLVAYLQALEPGGTLTRAGAK